MSMVHPHKITIDPYKYFNILPFSFSNKCFKSPTISSLYLPKLDMVDPLSPYDQSAEEEYIDMDIRSKTIFCYRISSPNHKEFEFHLATNPPHKQTSISTADEQFHKGNFFPLQFPHQMGMEEKLLKDSETMSTAGEINIVSSIELENNKSWSKKLKGIGQSLLKFKISKAYFKSLIAMKKEAEWSHRKSHTSVFLKNLTSKSVSATSLSSISSSSFSTVSRSSHTLKRSSSMSSEMELSVMGAIAYCKKSQQVMEGSKSAGDSLM